MTKVVILFHFQKGKWRQLPCVLIQRVKISNIPHLALKLKVCLRLFFFKPKDDLQDVDQTQFYTLMNSSGLYFPPKRGVALSIDVSINKAETSLSLGELIGVSI